MRILIVDDEPLARQRLKSLIAELGAGEVVGEAGHGAEALAAAGRLSPDLVLLDIRMPGMDGLEVARHLAGMSRPPAVVFTTAFGDHALAAFEASAVDYLLKPIRRERLAAAVERAQVLSRARAAALAGQSARTHLSAVVKGGLQLIPVSEVRYLQADRKYVTVAWSGGEILIEDSLKSLEEEFPEHFIRIHRNTLVAVDYVSTVEKGEEGDGCVLVRDMQVRLPVSRRLLPEVRRRLKSPT